MKQDVMVEIQERQESGHGVQCPEVAVCGGSKIDGATCLKRVARS